jgi:fermentation-respiration switch protein FrsA (DUF1100 family)
MGGATCLAVANESGAESIVTYAAPLRSTTVNHPPVRCPNFRFDLTGKARDLSNILIIHGDNDDIVPFSDAEELFSIAEEPKSLVRQNQGDHPMSLEDHQESFIRDTVAWFNSTLLT